MFHQLHVTGLVFLALVGLIVPCLADLDEVGEDLGKVLRVTLPAADAADADAVQETLAPLAKAAQAPGDFLVVVGQQQLEGQHGLVEVRADALVQANQFPGETLFRLRGQFLHHQLRQKFRRTERRAGAGMAGEHAVTLRGVHDAAEIHEEGLELVEVHVQFVHHCLPVHRPRSGTRILPQPPGPPRRRVASPGAAGVRGR